MARSIQETRTLQEAHTTLSPAEVIAAAKTFFPRRNSIYATFLEKEGPTFAAFRGQGGEEVVVAAQIDDKGTRVTGSSYMFDMQVARFLSMLPPYPSAEHDVEAVA
jgi:hypothetical protein